MGTERLLIEVTETGARVVQGRIGEIGKEAQKGQAHVDALKRALQFGIAALGLREAIQTISGFSREMGRLAIASGATGEELRQLKDEVKAIGLETGQGATEAAKSLGILTRAGLGSQESLRSALQLTTAVGADAGQVTTSLANVMQAFSIRAEQVRQAVDVLAVVSTRSNSSFDDLASTLARTANSAQNAGLDFRETAALISVLNDAGTEGRRAVTELQGALESLEAPTARDAAVFRSLGLDLERIRPSAVGLSAALQELGRRGVRLDDLGIKGGKALDILAARTPDVQKLLDLLNESDGAAGKFAATMDKTVSGAFRNMKSAVEDLVLAFDEAGLPTLIGNIASAVRLLANEIRPLTDALRDMNAASGIPNLTARARSGLEEMSTSARKKMNDEAAALREAMAVGNQGGALGGGLEVGAPAGDALRKEAEQLGARNEQLRSATELERIRGQLTLELGGARERLLLTEQALNELLKSNIINQEQYNAALSQTVLESIAVASASDVLKAKFMEIDTSVQALAASIGDTLLGAIDSVSVALADFAISGFKNVEQFREALANLLEDLGKQILALTIKMLILKTIQIAIGGVPTTAPGPQGGGLGGGLTGLQAGGPVRGGESVLVGEHGAEVFTPPSAGHIVPNAALAETPEVHVKVVNVEDPDAITEAMSSPAGEKVILNVLAKNRQSLGGI